MSFIAPAHVPTENCSAVSARRFLLGLTATPERTDNEDILHYFDGHISVEMRLWDALERNLLCPFQYFGLHDNSDLSSVRWTRGGYDVDELNKIYTANDARVSLVLEQLQKTHRDPMSMRALGFCVSIAHAEFMARKFLRRRPAIGRGLRGYGNDSRSRALS